MANSTNKNRSPSRSGGHSAKRAPTRKDVRAAAVELLVQLEHGSGSLTRLMPPAQQQVAEADRALLQALCYGYARWRDQLDGLLEPLLKKPLKNKDQDLVILMQLGILQLEHMRIADHAAVDTTVKVTSKLGKPWAKGLVNGVLRTYQREQDKLKASLNEYDALSHPMWLLELLKEDWPEQWPSIVDAANTQAPMTLRVNPHYASVDEYQAQMSKQDMSSSVSEHAVQALMATQATAVERLPGFAQGGVSVQDGAAQLAAPILAQRSSGRLLDACAAPGGKTLHALELNHWQHIVALDKHKERLDRVQENIDRLQLSGTAELVVADANEPSQWWDGKLFDAILLDAPCSGTGVIRRHPDIKLLRRESDIAALVKQQSNLLAALWPLLKPGGFLLYATCSILKCENEQQIAEFLAQGNGSLHRAIDESWGETRKIGRQIMPGQHAMDGFFYALLEKTA